MSEMSFVVTGMIPQGKGEGKEGVKSGKIRGREKKMIETVVQQLENPMQGAVAASELTYYMFKMYLYFNALSTG